MSSAPKAPHTPRTETLHIKTTRRTEWVNITSEVSRAVATAGIPHGVCHIFSPHTTAGITINEGDDPDVARDMEAAFDRMVHGTADTSTTKATPILTSRLRW